MTRLLFPAHPFQLSFFFSKSLVLLFYVVPVELPAQEVPEQESAGEIVEDNPAARIEYERMLMADPATGRIPDGIRKRELAFAARIPAREQVQDLAKDDGGILSLLADWRGRGPSNQGGRTRALAIDRTDESVILAGGVSGGIWRSQDTGKTWTRLTDPEQLQSVTCLVQDPRPGAENVWYYGTGEWLGSAFPITGEGLVKSTDQGASWIPLSPRNGAPLSGADSMLRYVYNVAIDPSNLNQDEVYAACYGGILRSVDGGENWKIVLGGADNHARMTDVAITSTGLVYATLSSEGSRARGIWRSEDGENWTAITPPNFPAYYDRISIGIAPSSQDVVYFFGSMYTQESAHGLWYHRYRGSLPGVWEDRTAGLPPNLDTYRSYCQVVRVSPQNPDVVFLGGVLLYRSTNGFRDPSTTQTMFGLHPDLHEVLFFPSNNARMLAGHDGGVSITQNGMVTPPRWESRNNGYITTQFYAVAVDHVVEGNNIVIGGAQDNGTWLLREEGKGESWSQIGLEDGGYCAIADSGRRYYISYQNGVMQRILPGKEGVVSERKNFGPMNGSGFLFINPFALDPADDRIMYVPGGRNLWRAGNLEASLSDWTKLDGAVIPSVDGAITALGLSRENPPHRLYYGTLSGRLYRLERADSGNPIRQDLYTFPATGGTISSIAVDPHDGNTALVGISSYNVRSLFYTSDGGATWSDVGGNLEEYPDGKGNGPSVRGVALLRIGDSTLYFAGTTAGLYSTMHLQGSATRWVMEGGASIGRAWVTMVDVRESDGFVAVATHGCGIFNSHILSLFEPASLSISPQRLDFGDVAIGDTVWGEIVLTDQGEGARSIRCRAAKLSPPFFIPAELRDAVIDPRGTDTIRVGFAPDSAGIYSDSVFIDHNATEPSAPIGLEIIGRGIPSVQVIVPERGYPLSLKLQISPNPFSKSVDLHIDIKKGGAACIAVLTVDGSEAAQIFDGILEAGTHTLRWTPTDLAGGVYYVQLQRGEESLMVPVVLER